MRYNRLYEATNFIVPTNYTQELSRFVANLRYEDLPQEVVQKAKEILIQSVGAALAAQRMPMAQNMREIALKRNGGTGGACTAWGTGESLSAVNAAELAGTLIALLNWSDGSPVGECAPGIIAAAWAAAEERHQGGKELITAIVAGYEAQTRIAMAVQPGEDRRDRDSWGETSWQIFGATVAAAKIYGLDARKVDQAIGIACESSTIPATYAEKTLSDARYYEFGFRARDGVMMAQSSDYGINNQRDTLDDPCCYTGGMTSNANVELVSKGLGTEYLILNVQVKHLPTDIWNETAAMLVGQLLAEHEVSIEDVAEVLVTPAVKGRMWAPQDGYQSVMHGQLSMPFAVVSVMQGKTPGADWYCAERLTDPQVAGAAQMVHAAEGGQNALLMDAYAAWQKGGLPRDKVAVRLKDGAVFCAEGCTFQDMDEEVGDALFRRKTASVLEKGVCESALKALREIESCTDVSELAWILGRKS